MAENQDEEKLRIFSQNILPHYMELIEWLFENDPELISRDVYTVYLDDMHLARMNGIHSMDFEDPIEKRIKEYLDDIPWNGTKE